MQEIMESESQFGAHYYKPLPVVLTRGQGIHLWDINDKQYIDMMSAYSAVSHGHCHPRIVEALTEQANRLTVVSRAFYTDKLAMFQEKLCRLMGYDKAAPMNTGAEAVELAVKAARKWAYTVKGVAKDKAEIIVCDGNFHGRTTTVISFSSEAQYKEGFGPLTPGFKRIPYGDSDALADAITENTAAFLVEPIQGEAGIQLPPEGYLAECAALCRDKSVLLICDEIQTGLGRTGQLLASWHDGVKPDGIILGKALGGGLLPVSAFLSSNEVMGVFTPGDHGSTFGGNPLSATVAMAALDVLIDEQLVENSAKLGHYFLQALQSMDYPIISSVRGKGLFIGVEINPTVSTAREVCIKLLDAGLLSKETHETVVRLAPPLIIQQKEIDEALGMIETVLSE